MKKIGRPRCIIADKIRKQSGKECIALTKEPFVTVQFVVLVPASSPFHPHASIYAKCISWSSRRIIDVPSSVKNVPSSFRSNRAPQSSSSVNKSRRGVRGVPVCVVIVLHQAARAGQGGSTRPVERESTAKRHHRCVSTCNVDGTVGRGGFNPALNLNVFHCAI